MTTTPGSPRPRPLLLLTGGLALVAATVATWFAWLSYDAGHGYDPYAVWQVVGCVLTLGALAVVGAIVLRPWLVVLVMPVAFTVTWSLDAARSDESGLWAVGAVMVLVGCLLGAAVLAGVVAAVRGARRSRLEPTRT